MVEHDA
ncbi:hypothetical protein D030_4558A, partial [Vibrio parahaemolyticus AQ3810]